MMEHHVLTVVVPLVAIGVWLVRERPRWHAGWVWELLLTTPVFWWLSQYSWDEHNGMFTVPPLSVGWVLLRSRLYAVKTSPLGQGALCWLQLLLLDCAQIFFVISKTHGDVWSGLGGAGALDCLLVHPFLVVMVLYALPRREGGEVSLAALHCRGSTRY